jgi:hypothetical protein
MFIPIAGWVQLFFTRKFVITYIDGVSLQTMYIIRVKF